MALTLTENAAEHIKKYAGEARLRLEVETNDGCAGLTYKPSIITRINDSDHVYKSIGVTIVVSQKSIPYLDGTEIDYIKEGLLCGWSYNNPNVNGSGRL